MTCVSFFKRNGKYESVSVSGHSGYAESGSDIVCAAVSSSVNLAQRILDNSSSPYDVSADEKAAIVTIKVTDDAVSQTVLRSLEDELRLIAQDYPKYLKVALADR